MSEERRGMLVGAILGLAIIAAVVMGTPTEAQSRRCYEVDLQISGLGGFDNFRGSYDNPDYPLRVNGVICEK